MPQRNYTNRPMRGIDVIGMGMMQGIPGLMDSLAKRWQEQRRQEEIQSLLGGLQRGAQPQNTLAQNAGVQLAPPNGQDALPIGGIQNLQAERPDFQPTNRFQVSPGVPMLDPRNIGALSQLPPQIVTMLQALENRAQGTEYNLSPGQQRFRQLPGQEPQQIAAVPPNPSQVRPPNSQIDWINKPEEGGGYETFRVPGTDETKIVQVARDRASGQIIPGMEQTVTGGSPPSARAGMPSVDVKKLTPAQRATIDKVARYELDPSRIWSLRSSGPNGSERSQMIAALSQLYPDYDITKFGNYQNARKDFTTGFMGRNINSLNTAIGHMGDMAKAVDDLQNVDLRKYNTVQNFLRTETGDPRVKRFQVASKRVGDELARLFGGRAVTDQENKQWFDEVSSSDSPAQLKGTIDMLAHLLGSRLAAINATWDNRVGVSKKFSVLDPRSITTLKKLGIDPADFESQSYDRYGISGEGTTQQVPQQDQQQSTSDFEVIQVK